MFQSAVHSLVELSCRQHPHHAMFTLIALRNLSRIFPHRSHRVHEAYTVNKDKQTAADQLIKYVLLAGSPPNIGSSGGSLI